MKPDEAVLTVVKLYRGSWRPSESDPFRALVRTVLSQNTTFRNEMTAFRRLERCLAITPESIAEASEGRIARCIRPAGMHRVRAGKLKALARAVLERYGGDLSKVLEKPLEEAREELMSLPGVGPKTADVVLMFNAHKPVLAVDRHIMRVSKRIGIVDEEAGYEDVRRRLEEIMPPELYPEAHLALIRFGREVCKARRPRCWECPVRDGCRHVGGSASP